LISALRAPVITVVLGNVTSIKRALEFVNDTTGKLAKMIVKEKGAVADGAGG